MAWDPEPIHLARLECIGNHSQQVAVLFHREGYTHSRYRRGIVENAVEKVRPAGDE